MKHIDNIVLAFDSFKGSASSAEIAEAAREAIAVLLPHCKVSTFVVADGGEGTTEAIARQLSAHPVSCRVHDPLMRAIDATYYIADDDLAIMEMAAAAGLTLIAANERNPLVASTFGVGEMITDALNHGCRRFILGIGGSATNDAGVGMLSALGFSFRDINGHPTFRLADVVDVVTDDVDSRLAQSDFVVACDVLNPFYGSDGAACVYAPQKGASPADVVKLDAALRRFAGMVSRRCGIDLQNLPGSGAAGGLGGALAAFLGAELKRGINVVLDIAGFDDALASAQLLITGEGRIDDQTAMGKALGGIVARAHKVGVPVVAIAGSVDHSVSALFDAALSIQNHPMALSDAINKTVTLQNVRTTVSQIIRLLSIP